MISKAYRRKVKSDVCCCNWQNKGSDREESTVALETKSCFHAGKLSNLEKLLSNLEKLMNVVLSLCFLLQYVDS